jgi:hypothetical protein
MSTNTNSITNQCITTSNDEFLASLGPSAQVPLTVADYADAKNLPEDYLRNTWGLADSNDGMVMPYRNADGTLFREKLRLSLSHDVKQLMAWLGASPTGQKTIPYGLDQIAPGTNDFWLVEGESDTQTALYRGVRAIGASGSNGFQEEFAKLSAFADAKYIFVVREPGTSGEHFVAQLAKSSIREKFLVVTLAEGLKDISELHLKFPLTSTQNDGLFHGALITAKNAAKPIPAPTEPHIEIVANPSKRDRYASKIEGYLRDAYIKTERSDYREGYRLILEQCPFNREHTGTSAAVFVGADGTLGFTCQHKSCVGNTWKQFRASIEGKLGKALAFEESEPAAESHVEINEPEPPQAPAIEDVPLATVGTKDMPKSVLDGWLGEVCKKRMLKHFPVAYAWPALVTVASAMVPTNAATNDTRCNLYTALVGPIHSGKSEAIKHAKLLLGIQSPPLLDLLAGSAEMLTSAVAEAGGRPRLYSPDELGHLLEKAQIQNSSFVYVLNRAFYETAFKVRSMEKKRKEVIFDAVLSIIGGIVDERFGDLYTSKTTGGFYDRGMYSLCPTGFRYEYAPFEGRPALQIHRMGDNPDDEDTIPMATVGNCPIPVTLDKSVFEETNRWRREDAVLKNPDCGRVVEIALRVATVCASFDRRSVLYGKDLGPAFELARYQARVRGVLKPNPGKTFEGQLFHKFFEFLTMHTTDGRWMTRRELFHRTCSYEIGLPVANKTLDAMIANDDVEEMKQPGKSGPPKRFVRIAQKGKVAA